MVVNYHWHLNTQTWSYKDRRFPHPLPIAFYTFSNTACSAPPHPPPDTDCPDRHHYRYPRLNFTSRQILNLHSPCRNHLCGSLLTGTRSLIGPNGWSRILSFMAFRLAFWHQFSLKLSTMLIKGGWFVVWFGGRFVRIVPFEGCSNRTSHFKPAFSLGKTRKISLRTRSFVLQNSQN